ncbi:tripartite tricarboxylate transporter permease [Chelativorans sp. J32]|uniref:tripartite tricarboxylate transporter permease n=1 Tax=Chelativorans sp. J32 TaxID=935840 RepID=UPI000486E6D3|nr:tripartite tricarboxylate transporter permease [Chelativorans sp. J32]
MWDNIVLGFTAAGTLVNLGYAMAGALLGTLIGILPGLGPLATIAILLPFTYGLEPLSALIMLAGIYYGSAYGGSTTAILMSLPGETASTVTVLDGYQMARKGRAGVAISTAAIGSFVAGTIGTLLLAAFATPLTRLAIGFGPSEYFALMTLGLVGAISLASGSMLKSVAMVILGLLLGLAGTDSNTGVQRFTFGLPQLWDGIDFIVLAVGLFAFGEIYSTLVDRRTPDSSANPINSLWPNREDFRRMIAPILRGTGIGSLLGVLPGAGISMSSFIAYSVEKRVSRHPEQFGAGAIEGVAGPESANNAAAQTAFIPTLTLGIPGSPVMALILGALMIHNIQPGPNVMSSRPELFWGLVASMWIGNLMLVLLNLPLVGIWVKLLSVPYRLLFPGIVMFSCIGIYASGFASFDLYMTAVFGVIGVILKTLRFEPAPLVLGFVLGPMLEENFNRALVLSDGSLMTFVDHPVPATMLGIAAVLVLLMVLPKFRASRETMFADE